MIILFYSCIILIIYTYFIYPTVIFLLSFILDRKVAKGHFEPFVTILITAYNEEKSIGPTIENKLGLNYPREKLEIIVVSDGSEDQTDSIVDSFKGKGVKLIRQEPRRGKTSALNLAIKHAFGEIIVFSDANSIYDPDAIRYLVENFNDPSVGYVTGKMIYMNHDGSAVGDGCSSYMKYENLLRTYETKVGSIVGVDGGIDAVRKSLYKPMRDDQLPDFVLPLMVVEQGYRAIYEPRAILKEHTLSSPTDEYWMRVRVSLRALWALYDTKNLLDIRRYQLFSWQYLSHKHLRYCAFIFIACAYLFNGLILQKSIFYKLLFTMQNLLYSCAFFVHLLLKKRKSVGILYIPYYFILINIAAGHAFIRFCKGQKQVIWTPRKG